MSSTDRRRILLERARTHGYLGVRGLARELNVDGSTIRRDLAHLERAGLVRRTRGGVLPADPADAVDLPYSVRRVENAPAKKALGQAAADLVSDGQSVIVDSGSTMYHLASALRARQGLTVITNDLMVGVRSAGHPTNRLHVTGGFLVDTVYTLVGPDTGAALTALHADWAFIGAEAIHPAAGVTNINVIEVPVKQAMIAAADRAVLVADSSKFGRRALAPVCPLAEFDTILTDDALPAEHRDAYGPALRTVQV
ncbi:DeoR/GlpR family DNA-binding transcription regulator [Amycolatopsis sp. CA-230715]|uniref:DeoR/GlpR family DNA-binding transcription regulator n=1 Tax=Amycolatopsis sp. CA-230715 TaxID=2745196 RepID=UPI001C01388E|nr:DeoR/GlpR family DNA-binding transcription regulator [Amycolatopsis sp. CA-230715]QWF83521.1 Glucitol operon repressor [Amycolatopsis sp. CA-230715]